MLALAILPQLPHFRCNAALLLKQLHYHFSSGFFVSPYIFNFDVRHFVLWRVKITVIPCVELRKHQARMCIRQCQVGKNHSDCILRVHRLELPNGSHFFHNGNDQTVRGIAGFYVLHSLLKLRAPNSP